ncbi:MAG: hypothetical protein AAFX56_17765 [Pseudomonadota bacterium]
MLTKVVAVLAGIVAAFAAIAIIQSIGHAVIPPPADLDVSDIEAFREWMATLPVAAFLFVLAAYYGGAFLGSFVAGWIAGLRSLIYPAIVGGLVLAGTIANLMTIPHPLWFSLLALIGIPVCAYFGGRLSPVRTAAP